MQMVILCGGLATRLGNLAKDIPKSMIEIEGKKYKVIENLGYQHSRGVYAKVVRTNDGEKIVFKKNGHWEFAKTVILPKSNYVGQ